MARYALSRECRTPESSLRVDIRTKAGSPDSSLAINKKPKVLDAEGRVSLVIEDEDLKDTMAVVVLLDASDRPIAKHPVTIGGDN